MGNLVGESDVEATELDGEVNEDIGQIYLE